MTANRVELQVCLAGRETLRHSPAGVPLLNAVLSHQSGQIEAGSERRVELEIAGIFAGKGAEAADRLPLGAKLLIRGFLAPKRRQSKLLALHVTEFELIEV